MALPATCLSICSGIGGLDLGLRRAMAGLRTICYVEREAFAASVLVARMEEATLDRAPIWDDLATFDGGPWRGVVDLVAGGTPCQDLSGAGRQAGLDGARSGLFFEFCRVVSEVQPEYVFWENVASGQAGRALPRVIDALDELGYTAARGPDGRPYVVLGADNAGAPHRRLRVFVLAYTAGARRHEPEVTGAGRGDADSRTRREQPERGGNGLANAAGERRHKGGGRELKEARGTGTDDGGGVGHALGQGLEGRPGQRRDVREELQATERAGGLAVANSHGERGQGDGLCEWERPLAVGLEGDSLPSWPPGPGDTAIWSEVLSRWPHLAPAQPVLRRVADGFPDRLDNARADRLRCLGNAVVPAQAELAWRILWRGVKR